MRKLLLVSVGLAGFGAQVVLLRQLLATLGGSEFAVALSLSAWILWEATGSLVGRARWARGLVGPLAFGAPLAALAASFTAVPIRSIIQLEPGIDLSMPVLAAVALALAALPALAYSTLFIAALGSTAPGHGYAWRGAGTVLGALTCAALFSLGVPSFAVLAAVSLPLAALAGPRLLRPIAISLLVLATAFAGRLERTAWELAWPGQQALALVDSPYGKTVTLAREGERTVLYDGTPVAASPAPPAPWAEELALIPLLSQPAPDRALIVGSSFAAVARAALLLPGVRVTIIHPDTWLVAAVRRLDGSPALDQLSEVTEAGGSACDCIIFTDAVPATLAATRYRTNRFYAQCRRALRSGGMLALPGPGDPAGLSRDAAALVAATVRTLELEFTPVRAVAAGFPLLLAGGRTGPIPETLGRRAAQLSAATILDSSYIHALLEPLRQDRLTEALIHAPVARSGLFAALVRESRLSSPGFARLYERLGAARLQHAWLLVAALAAVGLTLARRPPSRCDFTLLTSGVAGAALPVLVLFAWQLRFGSLYSGLTLLLGAFLGGAALGGLAPLHLGAGRLLLAADLVLVATAAALIPAGRFGPAAGLVLLNLAAGLALGTQFAAAAAAQEDASAPGGSGSAARAGRTAALDLGGGTIGGPLVALALVPLFGVAATALLVAGLKLTSALGQIAGLRFDSPGGHT